MPPPWRPPGRRRPVALRGCLHPARGRCPTEVDPGDPPQASVCRALGLQ